MTDSSLSPVETIQAARAALRARWAIPVLSVVLCTALGLIYNGNQTTTYTAAAQLSLQPLDRLDALTTAGIAGLPPPTEADLRSDAVLAAIDEEADGEVAREQLAVELFASPVSLGDPASARLTVQASRSTRAVRVANAWATSVVRLRNAALAGQFERVRDRLVRLRARAIRDGDAAARDELDDRIQALQAVRDSVVGDVSVAAAAELVEASDGRISLPLVILGSLLLGCAVALLLAYLDRRLRTEGQVAAAYQLPILARLRDGDEPVAQLTAITTKLELLGSWRSLLLTPARGGDVDRIERLAVALAQADTDSARPPVVVRWSDDRGQEPRRAQPPEATSDPERDEEPPAAQPDHEAENAPESIEEVVAEAGDWPALERRLASLSERRAIVVAEAPTERVPVLPATQRMDAWVVVVILHRTRADEARDLERELDGLERRPAGVVIMDRRR